MKIVVVGGHLAPALAVIEAMPKNAEILFIGRKHALEGDKAFSLEYEKIREMGTRFVDVETGRLQRKFTKHTVPSVFKLPKGFYKAFKILKDFKADAVVCFGGYVQVPVAFAAFALGIPVIAHEQTRRAGLANKIVARIARVVCVSWEESMEFFPKEKTVWTGIPLRREFLENVKKEIPPAPPLKKGGVNMSERTIYITGGSLGAHGINILIEGCLEKLLHKYSIIHQTGDAREYGDFERLEKIKQGLQKELQERYTVLKFIDPADVVETMRSADVVISRSGMNTVAELLYLEKPCLLIPLPHGQTNEQLENAMYAQSLGLGKVLTQGELTSEILYSQIVEFVDTLESKGDLRVSKQDFIKHDAAEKIVQIISEISVNEKQKEKQE